MLRAKRLVVILAMFAGLAGWEPTRWESAVWGQQALFDEDTAAKPKDIFDKAIIDATQPQSTQQIETRYGEVYVDRDSGPLKADVYLPQGEGPFPGVVVVHGGAWYVGTRAQLSGAARLLAQHGMTAVAISYRLAPKHQFPAQIEDCKAAVRWMREQAEALKIDPQRLGGYGYSAGAQLVALLGTTDADDGLEGVDHPEQCPSTRLQAVAAGGVPCDFRILEPDSKMLAFWLGGTRREVGEKYRLASPRAFVTSDDPPMFFFHGENDNLVPMESPQAMCKSLQQVGVSANLYVVPKIGHNFAAMDRQALAKAVTFLQENLGVGETP
ncbi:MAG: alpha/beta hydrolase fold domain-containing protein [Bythopirellula sp.]